VESKILSSSTLGDSKRFESVSTITLSITKHCTLSDHVSSAKLSPTARGYSNHSSIRLKKQRKKRRKQWHISTKRKLFTYRPQKTYHHIRCGKNASLDFYAESTLYTIPEHGAGLCHMRYITKNALGSKRVWSIHEHNSRPHHRRSTVVLTGYEPTDCYELRNEIRNTRL
jgi:hypothetical protein